MRAPSFSSPPPFNCTAGPPADGIVSHIVYVEDYPGPYAFINDPEYPGSGINYHT